MNETDDDEEEEQGGNDIVYDDFFCRDNDYGSDGDGDEGNVKITHRNTIEILGPRFIQQIGQSNKYTSSAVNDSTTSNELVSSIKCLDPSTGKQF